MSSGYTGGGASEYFNGPGGLTGRSIAATTMNTTNMANNSHNHHPSYSLYRSQQQLPAIFLDPSSQIARQTPTLIGKRNLSDFQAHHNQNQALNNLFLRSVKPRSFQHASPISPISPMDFSLSPELTNSSGYTSQRFGLPLIQQLRPNPINLANGSLPMSNSNSNMSAYTNNTTNNLVQVQNRVESDKKLMIDHRLQELEKQLLEDNDEEEGDAVSVITNNEWSETIQNLISPNQNPISPSPTSSTTSSASSSSSVVSPAPSCSKQSLMEAASAISEGKLEAASEILTRLALVSSPTGNSDQRLTDYMASALKSRVNQIENPPPVAELFTKEHADSTQLLYDVSPCFKLGFMAANLGILEATLVDKSENGNKLHVVDFDIGQGNQYVNLLHALSAPPIGKPPPVKITAVVDNDHEERLKTVCDMLGRLAEKLGLSFEFNVMVLKIGELSRESLGCEPDETLAVNFAFKLHRMPDESVSTENPRDELLRRVKGLNPHVVTLVEQEMNTNTAPFTARVAETCAHYGALFDSIESTMPRDNSERVKVEEGLSRKLGNSVACEGRERVERCEVFGKWRARMGMAGFELKPLSQTVSESMNARLSNGNRVNPGFTVKEENGGIFFGWMGRNLTVASAWR
ncbi:Scarecrow-like protein [Quillaja saponaria]|uniref:Scarecrow-like protein n=1 Tax=Quillaja saponaria TaxID=32244 RepID=A0AAD7PWG9_QUISA|nr:Scarecrow-like protein [Quillaja saponaria]